MSDIAIKIENVSKEYRLGAIGGTTLREEMHRFADKLFHRTPVNADYGKRFMALQNIYLEVKKGERLGIIGHNGAGKSTLLKLLSRVTAPTTGTISYNGRISSMLEVGTGFHGELTGRENIYMNGAILGMTKREIDTKIDQIIEFAEMRQFIDTPVKRYSSGMYVKLAFAVAAHLDNEILIMDEVLAVGDMKFQQKCLGKMEETSRSEGKTILYVSHNMNTIRQLCERCIVLNNGQISFSGEVNEAIGKYLGIRNKTGAKIDLRCIPREPPFEHLPSTMELLSLKNESGIYEMNSKISASLKVYSPVSAKNVILSVCLYNMGVAVTTMRSNPVIELQAEKTTDIEFEIDLSRLAPGRYTTRLVLSQMNELGQAQYYDVLGDSYSFEITQPNGFMHNHKWNVSYHGFITGGNVLIK